ncbi:TPM domain-containing protein [Niabella aquatica]
MNKLVSFSPVLLLSFVIALTSCSSTKQTTGTAKQHTAIVFPAQHKSTPAGVSFVADDEHIFSDKEAKTLDSLLQVFEKSNLIAIKITTVNNPSMDAANVADNNKELLKSWAAIHNNSNNCMVISISKQLKLVQIDYGTFVSKLLSPAETAGIIEQQFQPSFATNQMYFATWNGVNAIMNTIRGNIKF